MNREQIKAIEETATEIGGCVHKNYSGRGMKGKVCYGIICDDKKEEECVVVATLKGLREANSYPYQNDVIVYWKTCEGD